MGVLRRDGVQPDVDACFGDELFANVIGFHISFFERDIEVDLIGKASAGDFHVEVVDGVDLFENVEEAGGIERRAFYLQHLGLACENRAEPRRVAAAWAWFGEDEAQVACLEADERHALDLQRRDDDFSDFAGRERISFIVNDFHKPQIRRWVAAALTADETPFPSFPTISTKEEAIPLRS